MCLFLGKGLFVGILVMFACLLMGDLSALLDLFFDFCLFASALLCCLVVLVLGLLLGYLLFYLVYLVFLVLRYMVELLVLFCFVWFY